MTLVTLHRQAPVAPNVERCALCDTQILNALQDHLLLGQPGTADVRAAICQACGTAVVRLVDVCGPELTILVQDQRPAIDNLVAPRQAS
jgi:hypothetical protein